ncbi:ABC transporter permease [Arsenicitalea aurantiaca]|uniref:ABC transporter permease n=1 Tax=Arsenicitalea aurantiaca TaxID=1783274 RepID=A0A433X2M4_9HYPH|nr:ABC transporter permease [Arsenicitalea aurantiaca]RUT28280.1 ABC transporter permease [Arsenicitalea aurantiaca]
MTIASVTPTPNPAPPAIEGEAPWRRVVREFAKSWTAMFGLLLLVLVVLIAIFAPLLSPQNPYDLASLSIMDNRLPPGETGWGGMTYVLGTDGQGRDMLSAIMYGLRISLGVGVVSCTIALFIGLAAGLAAAYFGGRVDTIIMRIVDLHLSFPAILIALILLAVLGRGIDKIIIALIVVQWATFARTVRGAALAERRKEYIEAAQCLGLPQWKIVFGHLLPNCMPPMMVIFTVEIASAIALEATLSFLGVGLPITQPSLGLLISNGFQFILSGQYWISVYPGIALLVLIVAINLVGDQLRDILNPRNAQ